jgi:hypothetical protein
MKARYTAIGCAGVAAGIAIAAASPFAHDSSQRRVEVVPTKTSTSQKADDSVVSYSVSLAPDGKTPSRILRLKKMGVFSARCEGGRVRVTFKAGSQQTVLVTAAPTGGSPSSASVDPGKSFDPGPASTSSSYSTWQASDFSEASVDVATIGVAAQPGPDEGCLLTMQGIVQRRLRGTGVGATG